MEPPLCFLAPSRPSSPHLNADLNADLNVRSKRCASAQSGHATWWLTSLLVSGLVHHNYKWINTTKIPFITGVISHLLSGMSHQVALVLPWYCLLPCNKNIWVLHDVWKKHLHKSAYNKTSALQSVGNVLNISCWIVDTYHQKKKTFFSWLVHFSIDSKRFRY